MLSDNTRVMWPFPPNWRAEYGVAYEFRTDVFRSDDGSEQRRALRSTARKSLRFTALAHHDGLRRFNRLMDTSQNLSVVMPEVTRAATTATPLPEGTRALTLIGPAPNWIYPGQEVVLSDASLGYTYAEVASVAGASVTLTADQAGRDAGLRIHPALTGLVAEKLTAKRVTSAIAEIAVDFAVDPGSEPDRSGAAGKSHDGIEWLQVDHNWARGLPTDHEWPIGRIDFGRGVQTVYRPVAFPTTIRTFDIIVRDAAPIVDFFCRMRGQRGHFLTSTLEDDIQVTAVTGTQIRARGGELFDAYAGDPVRTMIEILRVDGSRLARTISAMERVEDDTLITLTEPLGISADQIARTSWLTYARFASDTLEVSYPASGVARMPLNIRSLPVEDDYGSFLRAINEPAIRETPQGDQREVIYL